jgi:hypothetical protein
MKVKNNKCSAVVCWWHGAFFGTRERERFWEGQAAGPAS